MKFFGQFKKYFCYLWHTLALLARHIDALLPGHHAALLLWQSLAALAGHSAACLLGHGSAALLWHISALFFGNLWDDKMIDYQ